MQCSIIWSIIYIDGESGIWRLPFDNCQKHVKRDQGSPFKDAGSNDHGTDTRLSASANGNQSPTFTWKANAAFVITIHLENGVSLVNETTGKTGTGNVSVKGGEKFHLKATTQEYWKPERKICDHIQLSA